MDSGRFPKSEKLVSRLAIEDLFSSGSKAFTAFPLRVVYKKVSAQDVPASVLVSVSKRHFHHAVDRNRAKRQIREAYRLNKSLLVNSLIQRNEYVRLAWIWLSDEPQPTEKVRASVVKLLHLISEHL